MTELDPELLDGSIGPRVLERVVLVAGKALPLLAVRVDRTHPRVGEPPADVRVLVGVDEPGRDVGGAAVDDRRVRRRRSDRIGLADGLDAAAGNEDRAALGAGRAQEQPAGDYRLAGPPAGHFAPMRSLPGRRCLRAPNRVPRDPAWRDDGARVRHDARRHLGAPSCRRAGSRGSARRPRGDRAGVRSATTGQRRREYEEAQDAGHHSPECHDRSLLAGRPDPAGSVEPDPAVRRAVPGRSRKPAPASPRRGRRPGPSYRSRSLPWRRLSAGLPHHRPGRCGATRPPAAAESRLVGGRRPARPRSPAQAA